MRGQDPGRRGMRMETRGDQEEMPRTKGHQKTKARPSFRKASLGSRGSLDFAGGTAIHVNAGIAALACVLVLGKRKGWPKEGHPPHSMPLVMLGTGILWFGWFG